MAEIKSLKHDERSYVAFVNRSSRRAALLWHNYEGTCVRYAILNPGGLHRMNTYVTHPWSVTDIDSGDFLKIGNQHVFYPRSHNDDDNNGPVYENVYIDLPVYTLLVRCLQVLRSSISREDIDSLNIPINLRHALKFVPDIKYTNYANFLIVEGNP